MAVDAAFRHNAFVYDGFDEYVERGVAFLRDGIERGEAAVVGDTRRRLDTIREAFGADARHVTFCDIGSIYTRPARTLAAYSGVFTSALQGAPSVRAIADVQLGPTSWETAEWTGYEALSNVAYSHLPVWVVCTYNANQTPDEMLEGVWRTHPDVLSNTWRESEEFEDPGEVLRLVTPAPQALTGLRPLAFGDDIGVFRERLAGALRSEGVTRTRAMEMLVAGTEIAANALAHGGGVEEVRVGRAEGRFVCEIVDRGPGFDDPLAGYGAPQAGDHSGLWVARQLAWRLEFFHASRGFTARIWL